jgi:hypothetical protein
MTDRELDAMVAEKVMGWWEMRPSKELWAGVMGVTTKLPPFSTDLTVAWQVVRKMASCGHSLELHVGPTLRAGAAFHGGRRGTNAVYWYASAPKAICRAALRACGVEVPA